MTCSMTPCGQEQCENWGGDGRACICALLDIDPPPIDEWMNK